MNTLSLSVKYRPIRIGWCIKTGDFEALRKALRLTFTMWGGRYNPLIPVDNPDLARKLIDLFRVDILWPLTADKSVEDFIKRFPHLDNPIHGEIFTMGSRLESQFVDISHPVRRAYEENFKNIATPGIKVKIRTWSLEDPLADVMLLTFGAVPPAQETGTDYLAFLKRYLAAEEAYIGTTEPLPQISENEWSLSAFSSIYLHQHYSARNHWNYSGIYVGEAKDFDDLVTFWNIRATNARLMFYDPTQTERIKERHLQWVKFLRATPSGDSMTDNSVAVWHSRKLPEVNLEIGEGKKILCAVDDHLWNGLNVKAPYIFFSEGSTLGVVEEWPSGSKHLSLQLPDMPFEGNMRFTGQHMIVSINPRLSVLDGDRHTFNTIYVPELNEFYGRKYHFEWNKARVEQEGLGVITKAYQSDMSLQAIEVLDYIQNIFKLAKIKASPSKPGLIASRLIGHFGGRLQGCRTLKIPGVRHLIGKYKPDQWFDRTKAMQIIRGHDEVTGQDTFTPHQDLYISSGVRATKESVFSHLLEAGVFRAGLNFICPSCGLDFWISLDDVATKTICEYCGYSFSVAPLLKDRAWAYRRSGLFGKDDNQQGGISTALLLQQMDTIFSDPDMLYTTALNLAPDGAAIQECETDFVIVLPRLTRDDGRIEIAVGECKTSQKITADDVAKMKAVAEAFPSDRFKSFVIFSKLTDFTQEEIRLAYMVNDKFNRRAILLTPRELEPYHLYERSPEGPGRSRHVFDFKDMADITQELFVPGPDLPPSTKATQ